VHPRRTPRSRGREDDAPQQIGANQRGLLRNEAADREPEEIQALEAHRVEEGDCVVSHRLDRVRRRACRGTHADVVERHHASLRGEIVDQRGIPVVEIPAEVLQQDERHITGAEVAVRVLDRILGCDSSDRGIGVAGLRVGRRLLVCGCHERSFQQRAPS
jgi:hypothetical protein